MQIAAAYPYVFSDPDDGGSDTDFGNLELGVKWRFFNSDNLQIAFVPVFAFGVTRSLAERGIGEDADVLTLPIAVEYQVDSRIRFNTMFGYASVDGGDDELIYGASLAYGLNARWQLLGELSGGAGTGLDDDVLEVRVGFDLGIRDYLHLLFAAATGLREPAGSEQLDYDIYLGLQWFF